MPALPSTLLFNAAPLLAQITWTIRIMAIVFVFVSVFMMLVILIQKPKGGGLSGAFGGAGGSDTSFVGAKVGDFLTILTVGCFLAFLLLAMGLTWAINPTENSAAAAEAAAEAAAQTSGAGAGAAMTAEVEEIEAEAEAELEAEVGTSSDSAAAAAAADGDATAPAAAPLPPAPANTDPAVPQIPAE